MQSRELTDGAAAMTSSRQEGSSGAPTASFLARQRPTAPMLNTPRLWPAPAASHSKLTSRSQHSVSVAPASNRVLHHVLLCTYNLRDSETVCAASLSVLMSGCSTTSARRGTCAMTHWLFLACLQDLFENRQCVQRLALQSHVAVAALCQRVACVIILGRVRQQGRTTSKDCSGGAGAYRLRIT